MENIIGDMPELESPAILRKWLQDSDSFKEFKDRVNQLGMDELEARRMWDEYWGDYETDAMVEMNDPENQPIEDLQGEQ